jgi:hypothetical protein
MKSLHLFTVITALTIVTTISTFGFIVATAQTMTDNATKSGQNITGGNNTTTGTNNTNQSGSIAGVGRCC